MFGITIRTASDARPFWQLVDRASAFETVPSIRALGYPPHITLVRYSELAPDLLLRGLAVFEGEPAFSLTFDRIGVFDAESTVLWLSPRDDPRLLALQARLHEIIAPALCDPHYRPRQWTPHLTIAMSIAAARRGPALEFAMESFEPFSMTFDAADCVSWPPVQVLRTQRL